MANATDYYETKLIDQWFRGIAFTPPGTWFIGLFKADPTELGTITQEVSGGNYARAPYTSNTTNWTAATDAGSAKRTSNGNTIIFPNPTADWGTVTHWGILDTATLTAGQMIVYGALGNARTILSGDNQPSFAIGALTIDFS